MKTPAKIAVLESERSIRFISDENINIRIKLIEEFEKLPTAFFSRLRHFQPQVGCLNRCSFCSQGAGTAVWYMDEVGLANLFSALKTVSIRKAAEYKRQDGMPYLDIEDVLTQDGVFKPDFRMPDTGLLGYGRTNHRPGVLFCYLDNDISSYPFLDRYLQYAFEDLGVRIRISTIGFSKHNSSLHQMHERISNELAHAVAGVRLSVTPYSFGWTEQGERSGQTSRSQFMEDTSHFLKTYQPLFTRLGHGARTGCVELRFKPLLKGNMSFHDFTVNERHVLHVGPYLLISREKHVKPVTAYVDFGERGSLVIEGEPIPYLLVHSDRWNNADIGTLQEQVMAYSKQLETSGIQEIRSEGKEVSAVELYCFENEDGPYYVADPIMKETGLYAKQFYPGTSRRPTAGYIDSERYFLNALLMQKRRMGVTLRRGLCSDAGWDDADQVLLELRRKAEVMVPVDSVCAEYIVSNVIPMVAMYRTALEKAGYPASYFFDPNFTIDTGTICNLGQAFHEFRDLASRPNLPLTPQHERSYGHRSSLSKEGNIWRLSVMPRAALSERAISVSQIGKRNKLTTVPSLLIEEESLSERSDAPMEGPVVRRIVIPIGGEPLKQSLLSDLKDQYLIPGQRSVN